MSKHYGISGVGSDVQYGKNNGRLKYDSGVFQFTLADGATLENVEVAEPTQNNHAATKAYVDTTASGLDPKTPSRVATTSDPGGTYNSTGGAGGTGQFTGMPNTIDGVALGVGNRVLVKDDTTLTQNGIYEVVTVGTGSNGVWDRASDMDGTPSGEVAGGNFTFVNEGTVNANSGWVLQGSGVLTLNTDDINWVQFSGAGNFTGGVGITLTGSAIDLDFNDGSMSTSVAIAGGDLLAFADVSVSDTMQIRTFTNMMADLDIVNNLGGNGFAVQTASDTYAARTITAAGPGNLDGISVANGNGVSANPTIGLDIVGSPTLTGTINTADLLMFYDSSATANVTDTVGNLLNDLDIANGFTSNGLLVRTAADAYDSRTLTASTTASEEGLVITNGDGVSGNPTIGLDIDGTTASGGNAADTDTVLLFNGANNRKYTIAQLAAAPAFGATTSITDGDSSVTVTDAGSGLVETTLDGTTVIETTLTETTFNHDVVINQVSAITAEAIPAFKISGQTSGTPATGIGVEMQFEVETTAGGPGNLEVGGELELVSTDIGASTEDFDYVFKTMAGGAAPAERARISSAGNVSATSFTASGLTNNRVLIAGTSGLIEDDADFTFDGTILSLAGNMDITGDLDVDNINLNGNTVSITDTNGNLNLQANGTGDTRILDGAGNEIIEFLNGTSAINHLSITAGASGNAPTISTNVTGSGTNVDLDFVLKGTGVLTVSSLSGNYEDNVTADDDIPNKLYVDNAVETGNSAGVFTAKATVNLTNASAQTIGTLPANADVLRTYLIINVASDAATTVTVGDATNGASSYMTAAENDPESTDTYIADNYVANGAGDRTIQATVATAGTVGSATCVVEYRLS